MEHSRGKGRCQCLGRLMDCMRCRGKACVHRIFETGETHCEHGAEHGCNASREASA